MESECYRVKVLYYLNPHLIWVKVEKSVASKHNADISFEQIGVYGILPIEQTIDVLKECLESRESLVWAPAVVPLMKEMLSEATDIWFSPTYIDRRSSIFDNNIHKYGEITIKTKDGQLRMLSKMLTKTSFAHFNEVTFHHNLSTFKLKTNLDKHETHKIVKALEKAYMKSNSQTHDDSFKNQTTVYQEAQKLEMALTVSNLDKHNKALLPLAKGKNVYDLINNKYEDLKLCKDADEHSVGRGMSKPKKSNDTYDKNVVESSDSFHLLDKTKEILLKRVKKKVAEYNIAVQEAKSEDTSEIIKEIKQDISKINDKLLDVSFETYQYKKPKKDKKSPIILPIQEYNTETHKLITMGPPDIDKAKLGAIVVSKNASISNACRISNMDESGHTPEGNLVNFKENPLAGLDSEVDFPISKPINTDQSHLSSSSHLVLANPSSEKNIDTKKPVITYCKVGETIDYSVNDSSNDTSNLNSVSKNAFKTCSPKEEPLKSKSVNSSLSSVNTYKSPKGLPKYILKKIRRGNPDNILDISSDTDTSAKDNSSSSDANVNKYDANHKTVNRDDSDNETTISEIVKRLDFESKSTIENKSKITINHVSNHQNHVNPFKNVDASISKFVDKLVSHILMVHSKTDCRVIPTYQLRDVPFNTEVFFALTNMNVKTPTMMQTVSWPTILRGNSLFMISPMNSGKTLGYAAAVCRIVADFDVEDFPDSTGPICIILCATSISVTAVEKLCRKFLGHTRKVLSCYAGVNEAYLTTILLNGCDVLVCTPPSLFRLLQVGDFAVDLRRLNTFVLDDCERIGLVYLNEVRYFILKIKEMLKKRPNRDLKVQYIAASRSWCNFMESLAKSAPNSVVCIGSFQECVFYSKAGMSVVFSTKENKIGIVLDFLESIDRSKKTVIVCRDDKEVCDIEIILRKVNRHVFTANSQMTIEDLHTLSNNWAEYDEPLIGAILVCCDDNLLHLNVTDAHNLLQYSLPSLFSIFSRRYSVLTENYPSIFQTQKDEVKIKIILESDNVEQLPKIVNFLKRCTTDLPSSLDEACDIILREKDFIKAKQLIPICDNMLSLGECPDFWNCIQRHSIFKEFDAPSDQVPTYGTVTFQILHYHNAITYSARLLTSIVNSKTHKFPQNYTSVSLKLGLHFSQVSNRIPLGIAKVGDICAVSMKENFFERCQVIKIVSRYEKNGHPKEILIKLIDEEKWEKTRDIYLYNLPEHLKDLNCFVSQVKLANLEPKDKDVTFSDIALQHLRSLTETEDDLYMRARISMTIGNCILVDELEACQDLSSSKQTVVRYNFKAELLKVHALLNIGHLPKLEKLCKEGGLEVKADVTVEKEESEVVKKLPEPRWAHLEDDMQLVYFASAEDPNKFFVRLKKFDDCNDLLTKDIQEYIAEETTKALDKVNVDDIVLAKFPDDSLYYRAKIDSLVELNKYKCFFVDHGDWRVVLNKDVVAITEKLFTKMPFQAIECRLVGVKPLGNQWPEYSTNYFCDQCFVGTTDNLKQLYVKYFTKERSESTKGHKYGVVLIDTTTEEDVIINKTLLQHQLAQEDAEEIQFLENLDFKRRVTDKPEDYDEWVCDDADYKAVDLYEVPATNETNNNLLFGPKPIRSVPLVASDDENDDWDMEFDKDELKSVFKVAPGKGPPRDTSTVLALTNIKMDANNIDSNSTCSSKISDFEIIPSQKVAIQELDSDDLSTPEQTTLIIPFEVKPHNAVAKELKELEIQRKPKLCWRQTKTNVSIRVEVIGVQDYELNITDKHIKFACEVLDTKYRFDFELYGVVDPKKSSHQPKGLYIYVKLSKLLPRSWMTLQLDDKIPRKWIVYDPDSIEMSSDDDDDDDMARKKEDMKKLIENAHYNDSDDDLDEDAFGDDILLHNKKIGYESD